MIADPFAAFPALGRIHAAVARILTAERFVKFVWFVMAYNLAAIAWGAFVRATFSGDGCGSHWPTCGGQIIPDADSLKKMVEFSHRVSTGMIVPMTVMMVVWSRFAFTAGHQARKASLLAFGMTLFEALIGAGLVLFHLTDRNNSVARAGVMSVHVVSTFVLLSCIAVAAIAASTGRKIEFKGQGAALWLLAPAFIGVAVLGVSGAVSALGHTLAPTKDVIAAAANVNSFWMVRLQPMHPYLACAIGLYVVLVAGLFVHLRPDRNVTVAALALACAYAAELGLGLVNIQLNAPVWLQMTHLVAADAVMVSLVLMSAYALAEGVPRLEVGIARPDYAEGPIPRGRALVKEYVALTKPLVISLLLFTTLAAMFIAARGWPGGWLFLAVAIGGYMSAGAANAINMVIDRDIDETMKRTRKRPTVTQNISSRNVLLFSLAMALGSFALLWSAANLLTAMLSFSGLVFYVVVYTLILKRRTWQNIVIGGAAGSFPPLVGWAAVTGSLSPLAWYLFAIIFLWTPVHFWALALMIKDDYAAAGVPMLPAVKGDRMTVVQIGIYTVLTVIVTIMPMVQRELGYPYLVVAVGLNALLLSGWLKLFRKTDRPNAVSLYKYSMLYLALLFMMVAVDRVLPS